MSSSIAPPPSGTPRLALIQLLSGADKLANLASAREAIGKAARDGANIIALPECFNSPYATDQFPKYAETIPATGEAVDAEAHPSTAMLSGAAAAHGIFLVGGTTPSLLSAQVTK
jgi:omega-amidase